RCGARTRTCPVGDASAHRSRYSRAAPRCSARLSPPALRLAKISPRYSATRGARSSPSRSCPNSSGYPSPLEIPSRFPLALPPRDPRHPPIRATPPAGTRPRQRAPPPRPPPPHRPPAIPPHVQQHVQRPRLVPRHDHRLAPQVRRLVRPRLRHLARVPYVHPAPLEDARHLRREHRRVPVQPRCAPSHPPRPL